MIDNTTIKAKARAQLGGSIFASSWLILSVCCVICQAVTNLSFVLFVPAIMISGPITYSLSRLCLKRARGEGEFDIKDIFKGFSENLTGALLLGIMRELIVFLWSLLFIVPGIIKRLSYSMAFYIQLDDPTKDWKTCLNESAAMMEGHKWDLFCIDLVMYLWNYVGSLACGFGTIFVTPYQQMSYANFYLALKENRANNFNNNQAYANANQNYGNGYNQNYNNGYNQNNYNNQSYNNGYNQNNYNNQSYNNGYNQNSYNNQSYNNGYNQNNYNNQSYNNDYNQNYNPQTYSAESVPTTNNTPEATVNTPPNNDNT